MCRCRNTEWLCLAKGISGRIKSCWFEQYPSSPAKISDSILLYLRVAAQIELMQISPLQLRLCQHFNYNTIQLTIYSVVMVVQLSEGAIAVRRCLRAGLEGRSGCRPWCYAEWRMGRGAGGSGAKRERRLQQGRRNLWVTLC